jgi:hypothetical protein
MLQLPSPLQFVSCSRSRRDRAGQSRPTRLARGNLPGDRSYPEALVPYLDFPYILGLSGDRTVPAHGLVPYPY